MLESLFAASLLSAALAGIVAAVSSILFLRTRDFWYDSVALAVTEVGLLILAAGIVAGTIAWRTPAGQWWTWDPALTAALVCFLLYAPYLMLRNAIEEPTRRAASAAVVSIFAACNVPAIVTTIHWWLPRRNESVVFVQATWFPLMLLAGGLLSFVRFRQEQRRRAEDAERRSAQEI